MDNQKLRLCTICARGGSKGVPNKNIRPILGRPLIAYSIQQAKESALFDAVAVSSDSREILSCAQDWGADYLIERPQELATDQAAKLPAIRHAVLEAEARHGARFDIIVDLDATSPLRDLTDIREAVALLESSGAGNVITGAPARRSPYFNMVEVVSDQYVRLVKPLDSAVVRRQDAPPCYDMNASIYVWKRELLLSDTGLFNEQTRLYVMPEARSHDIDTELDFQIVAFMMEKGLNR